MIATFDSDPKVWKSAPRPPTGLSCCLEVHFSILGREDCPLKGPAEGEEPESSEESEPRRRSRTPDVWEQERQRVLTTQRVVLQAVQAEEEKRLKTLEEERLNEDYG